MADCEKDPFISVIVPMYNVERYIKDCIDSILNQTFKDFEIIIVDDASPDNSFDLCQRLYGNNKKVRFLRHMQNKGQGPARNTGIENARGEYVFFLDSDDLIVNNALEILHNAAIKTNADVINTAAYYTTAQDDGKPINFKTLEHHFSKFYQEGFLKYDPAYRIREHWMTYATDTMTVLKICKREFLQKNNLRFIDVISEDEIFTFDILCTAEKFYILPEAIYIYRKRENSTMTEYNSRRYARGVHSLIRSTEYLKQRMKYLPQTAYDKNLQDAVISTILFRQNTNHVLPFYDEQGINPQLDEIIFNEFLPTFKDNVFFVKYLLNNSNIYRKRFEKLATQYNNLVRQTQQQTNEMISAFRFMPVVPQKIVFLNSDGQGYGGNVKNIADEILRRNLSYYLIWLVNDTDTPAPEKIRKVAWNSTQALFDLATAEIIITNSANELPFVKKQSQYLFLVEKNDRYSIEKTVDKIKSIINAKK